MADFSHYFLISVVSTGAVLFICIRLMEWVCPIGCIVCLRPGKTQSGWKLVRPNLLWMQAESTLIVYSHAAILTVQH